MNPSSSGASINVEKPVACITGAARGIGAATAREFAARGYWLSLVDCDRESLEKTAALLPLPPGEPLLFVGDLADLDFCRHVIERTREFAGRFDVLINNAAWRELATMRDISLESWERTLRVCLTAPAFLSRWAAEIMAERRKGVIVNVTSIMAHQSAGIATAYIAAKGGLESLTHDLAALYGAAGIRVAAVAPGAVDTELSRDYPSSANAQAERDDDLSEYGRQMPMLHRFAQPDEIAKAIAWIASDEASYFTGSTLVLDGGWSRHHWPWHLKRTFFPEAFS